MTASAALTAAVDVFRTLGWADATVQDVEHLPLGTPEQQRVARTGLATGDWGEWGQIDERRYGFVKYVDVDLGMLTLFAVRVGVDAARTAQLLSRGVIGDDLVTRVLAARGPDFAAALLRAAYRRVRRAWEHSTTALAGPLVRLVGRYDLPVPDDVEYLRDWAVYASGALSGEHGTDLYPHERGWAPRDVVTRRLPEHVRAGVAAGVPATGPFGTVFTAAVAQGLLARDEAAALAVAALDSARRPGDRKVWAQALTGPLALTDAEIVAHADALVPVLAHGEAPVVAALGPALVAGVDDASLTDVLAVTLTVRTKAVLRTLLTTAAARPRPDDAAREVAAALVRPLTTGPDRSLARAAAALVDAWDLGSDAPDEPGPDADGAPDRWRPVPAVWEVPRFEVGEVTVAAVTTAAALLTGRPEGGTDVEVERFLAVANALAHVDREAARTALGGVRGRGAGLASVPGWVTGEPGPWLDRPARDGWRPVTYPPLAAREAAVVQRLGEVPVLLSTPTWEDLQVDPADLVERLRGYAAAGATASEADVYLAALRCDPARATDEVVTALEDLAVPVVLQSGATASFTAGPTLAAYLRDPLREPELVVSGQWRQWRVEDVALPASLEALPPRLKPGEWYGGADRAELPTWGDAASSHVNADGEASTGVVLRQLARRATPLTPGLAVNLLGAQRNLHPAAAADGAAAVHEAWERGLLRPGVADVGRLDWAETPSQLASFARTCRDLADEGLLAVVWPLLDDLLQVSLRGSRLLAGTAEVAETLQALLPDVERAVAAGHADPDTLALPGTRALAGRGGSSRAVVAARAIVAQVPEAAAAARASTGAAPGAAGGAGVAGGAGMAGALPGPRFDEVWPVDAGTRPAIEDGATVRASWVRRTASQRLLALDLTLPDGAAYRVVKTWYYDVTTEGHCAARPADDPDGVHRWLYWDAAAGGLVVGPDRSSVRHAARPDGHAVPPLSTALVAVLLASACGDDTQMHLHDAVRDGLLGSAGVRSAIRALLPSPDVDPARLARLAESDPTTLPVLWPVLVEAVRHAAALPAPAPRWLPRVLDVALHHAVTLREAAARGLLPADAAAWPGLADLAARPATTVAPRKARALADALLGTAAPVA